MAIGQDIFELEKALNYRFADIKYLEGAMTHASYTNEQRAKGINVISNERLEFLGDAILQMVVSEYLYNNFKRYREGALTRMRQQLVCEATLAKIARGLELGKYLNLGHGEELTDCRSRPKILADAMEALIAAVYLDSRNRGSEEYRSVITCIFEQEINIKAATEKTDYKTLLQQLTEQDGASTLEYRVIDVTGPEHDKLFTVSAYINNNEVGMGTASTKKNAEMKAAKMALRLFGVIE